MQRRKLQILLPPLLQEAPQTWDGFRSLVGAVKGRKLRRRIRRERPLLWEQCSAHPHVKEKLPSESTTPSLPPPRTSRSQVQVWTWSHLHPCIFSPPALKWQEWLCRVRSDDRKEFQRKPHYGLRAPSSFFHLRSRWTAIAFIAHLLIKAYLWHTNMLCWATGAIKVLMKLEFSVLWLKWMGKSLVITVLLHYYISLLC